MELRIAEFALITLIAEATFFLSSGVGLIAHSTKVIRSLIQSGLGSLNSDFIIHSVFFQSFRFLISEVQKFDFRNGEGRMKLIAAE